VRRSGAFTLGRARGARSGQQLENFLLFAGPAFTAPATVGAVGCEGRA